MVRRLIRVLKKVFWLLPGFLLWASFPPMGETSDVLFALAPLMWLTRQGSARLCFRRWFLNGLAFWVATLAWMPAIVKNGGPWPLVVLGWGALSVYCALYFGAYGWLAATVWGAVRTRGYGLRLLALVLVEPLLWAGLELVRARFGGGFAWNQLGVAGVAAGYGAPAVLGGVFLVSAFIVLINGTFASLAERILEPIGAAWQRQQSLRLGKEEVKVNAVPQVKSSLPRWVRSIETILPLTLVLIVFVMAQGMVLARRQQLTGPSVRVALVQRNFPCAFQVRSEDPLAAYTRLIAGMAGFRPDLVVLPESALAEFGAVDAPSTRRVVEWLRQKSGATALLAGGARVQAGHLFNSAALYQAGQVAIYDKVHLVPFGEFIPGDKWVPVLQRWAPVGSCTPGELRTLPLETVQGSLALGVAICFEDTDSSHVRALAMSGATLLTFITNDSWFSNSEETQQHAWQARARAIETGLPVVRVGNSGVTGVLLPDGHADWLRDVDGQLLVDAPGVKFERVKTAIRPSLTPYVRWGDGPLFVAFLLLIGLIIMLKYRHEYKQRRKLSV